MHNSGRMIKFALSMKFVFSRCFFFFGCVYKACMNAPAMRTQKKITVIPVNCQQTICLFFSNRQHSR